MAEKLDYAKYLRPSSSPGDVPSMSADLVAGASTPPRSSLSSHDPTWWERARAKLLDSGVPPSTVNGILGNALAGDDYAMGLIDLTPIGQAKDAQEAGSHGDALGIAMAAAPFGIGKKGGKAVGKKAAKTVEEVFDPEARLRSRDAFMAEETPSSEYRANDLFDLSRETLEKRPDLPQFDLPRNVPARGASERILDLTSRGDVRDEMKRYALEGAEKGGKGWYNLQQLRDEFISELGADRGDAAFRRYVNTMSATSPRSKLPANIKNASMYYHLSMGGKELKGGGNRRLPDPSIPPEDYTPKYGSESAPEGSVWQPPREGYGHLAQNLHRDNVIEALGPEGWDVFTHPKPPSYGENLYGNWQPATIDAHAIKLPSMISGDERFLMGSNTVKDKAGNKITTNPAKDYKEGRLTLEDAAKDPKYWEVQPRANEYPAMERYYKDIADELGMDPAQFQASVWVGGGKRTGLGSDESKSALEFFADAAIAAAKKRGVPPRQIVRDFVRGKIPLAVAGGGAAVTVDALDNDTKQQLGIGGGAPPGNDWAAGLREGEVY